MNSFMNELTNATNFSTTANGALAHKTTRSAVLDMFALCGAFRKRSDEDCILKFKNALEEDESLALKCLFYLRDIRGGQGERRFFRVCFKWLCNSNPEIAIRNIANIAEYGRYDDIIYSCFGTKVQNEAFAFIKHQLALDVQCKTPSLLGKWLPSENASSKKTKEVANALRLYLRMTHREYRKTLSTLRSKINVLEKLMSENRWDEIEFDKIPSAAGLKYKNAFARRDILKKKYEAFANDETKTVNAGALYPYDIIRKVTNCISSISSDTDRKMLEKYWNNQIDVLEGKPCKMLCVCDTSGSMRGTPIDMAIGLSMYCAERIGGPFKNHYISFSSRPQLIKIEGIDFVDKVRRIYRTNLCEDTNIEATFDLLKNIALRSKAEDIPEIICIISDMQINSMSTECWDEEKTATEMERIRADWERCGLKCPRLIYWNAGARQDTILDLGPNVSFVSGASPMTFKQVITGKTGYELMLEVLVGSGRYNSVS